MRVFEIFGGGGWNPINYRKISPGSLFRVRENGNEVLYASGIPGDDPGIYVAVQAQSKGLHFISYSNTGRVVDKTISFGIPGITDTDAVVVVPVADPDPVTGVFSLRGASLASFDAEVPGSMFFESFEAGFSNAPLINFANGFTLEETGGSNLLVSSAFGVTDGTKSALYSNDAASVLELTFSPAVRAVGFDLTLADDRSVTISTNGVDTVLSVIANATVFYGFISPDADISLVTVTVAGGAGVSPAIDSVSFGPIP